jgi:hypothetical protein
MDQQDFVSMRVEDRSTRRHVSTHVRAARHVFPRVKLRQKGLVPTAFVEESDVIGLQNAPKFGVEVR